MKFRGEPNQLVRITKLSPMNRRKVPKSIRFDSEGIFETENSVLIKRLSSRYEAVEEVAKKSILTKQEEVEPNEEEVRALAKEAGIKKWHVKSIENLLKELSELDV